jgi:protein-disulfide isomerase
MKWDVLLTTVLTLCALGTTALVARRELIATRYGPAEERPVFIKTWRSQLSSGILLGSKDAPVQLIEFADFECPYCASFHESLAALRRRYPTQLAITYVHFPLPGHRYALPAAQAAECAAAQGRFEAMHDALYDGQRFLGIKPWREYATASSVPDLAAFDECTSRTESGNRIEQGRHLAADLNVRGTPTILINGWMINRTPSDAELEGMVKLVLTGHSPVSKGQ